MRKHLKSVDRALYRVMVLLLQPLHYLLVPFLRGRVHADSVLHISEMVHVPWFFTRALRRHGVKADYLARGSSPHWDKCDFKVQYSGKAVIRLVQEIHWFWTVVARYQVIHAHFEIMLTDSGWEMPILKSLGRKIIAHHRGCHARDRTLNQQLNPDPLHDICAECDYVPHVCATPAVLRRRRLMARFADFAFCTTPDMLAFNPQAQWIPFLIPEVIPPAPSTHTAGNPIHIVHATNHPGIEGTRHIVAAIDNLKAQGYPLRWTFLHHTSQDKILEAFAQADLTIGKMKMGYFANTQIESMMLGVPAITFVRPEFMTPALEESGLILTDLHGLEETLKDYLDHPHKLAHKRARARSSILALHDNERTIPVILAHYRRLLGNES